MVLYEILRKANRKLKEDRKRRLGMYLSPVRRIERVHPVAGERVCAMTFDDGPSSLAPMPAVTDRALTEHLADTLLSYGFRATFDIVGDTSENYPDCRGAAGKFYWGGVRYDHYPDFDEDGRGGAKNCPALVQKLVDSGFELANHGYQHRLFGFSPVYAKRVPLRDFDAVVGDLKRLHTLVSDQYGIEMKMSRPPHYIDGIAGGYTSYDAYELMGYQYMAASFDGGGWMPQSGSYDDEVVKMVSSLERALDRDPDFFNGQIIFQKDGCNMSRQTPIASALGPQLEVLKKYGYRVTTVSELVSLSPFEDLSPEAPCFDAVRRLTAEGRIVGFRDNTFRPDEAVTFGELCAMLCPREEFSRRILLRRSGERRVGALSVRHRYATAIAWAAALGEARAPDAPVDSALLDRMIRLSGGNAAVREDFARKDGMHTHASAVMAIAGMHQDRS